MEFREKIITASFCLLVSISYSQKPELNKEIVGSIGNAEMNVLYTGYKNKVSISASGLTKSMKVSCEGCASITPSSKENGIYFVKVLNSAKFVTITISDESIETPDIPSLSKEFKVLPMPKPHVYIDGANPFSNMITKYDLANGRLICKLQDGLMAAESEVVGCSVSFDLDGVSKSFDMEGDKIPSELALALLKLESGSVVLLEPKSLLNGAVALTGTIAYIIK